MQNDISGIIELLRHINNRTSQNIYNDPFIDGIHHNFPDVLYNNARFTSVQSLMEYINHQMNNNHNVYNRNFADYWNTRTPIGTSHPSDSPASAIPAAEAANNIFSQIHNDIFDGARMLNSLSNATTRTQTPVDSPLLNGHRGTYMDDEILLYGIGSGPTAVPVTPQRPARRMTEASPPILRRGRGVNDMFRNLIPDFLSMTEPTLFMASGSTYQVHPLNELTENNVGLTHAEINRVTHMDGTSEREGDCPICYDGYSGNDLRVINNCNHAFHSECIERWFVGNRTCPMCRANVIESARNLQTG